MKEKHVNLSPMLMVINGLQPIRLIEVHNIIFQPLKHLVQGVLVNNFGGKRKD